MPLRLIAALGSAVCFAVLGFSSAGGMQKRCRGLDCCLEAVRLVEYQLLTRELPLWQAVTDAQGGNAFLSALCREGDIHSDKSWQSACESLGLKKEDAAILLGLKHAAARREKGERESFRLCREALTQQRQRAEALREREGCLHKRLGLLLGAAALILLC